MTCLFSCDTISVTTRRMLTNAKQRRIPMNRRVMATVLAVFMVGIMLLSILLTLLG